MKLLKKPIAVLLCILTLLSLCSVTAFAAETSENSAYAGQTTVQLKEGEKLEYYPGYGWTTHMLYADSNMTYCVKPDLPVPPTGSYSTDTGNLKELTSSTYHYQLLRKALYYCYGGAGFSIENSAFKTDTSKHQQHYSGNTPAAFMGNLKFTQYGYEALWPSGSNLHYLLTHRVISYIYGYSNWNKNLPSADWETAIKELSAAINNAPSVPISTKLYIMDVGSNYQQVLLQKEMIKLQMQKTSANTEITNGNSCYSLEGAKYNIYLDKNCTEYFGYIRATADGFGKYGSGTDGADVPLQVYYAKEVEAPKGYALDNTVYEFKNSGKKTSDGVPIYSFSCKDNPQNDPIQILLQKIDSKTGKASAALAGAEFTIKYYTGFYSTEEELVNVTAERSWIVKTDKDGFADLSPDYLVSGNEFYKNSLGFIVLPLGTISITESKAPIGYKLNNELFIRQITSKGQTESVSTFNAPIINEERAGGKLKLIKTDSTTNQPLANAVYGIYSQSDTDTNGMLLADNKVEELKTDKNGSAVSSELVLGTYYVQEITAPENYNFDKTVYTVEVTAGSDETPVELTVTDTPATGTVTVQKKAEDNFVADVEFSLSGTAINGVAVQLTAKTDKTGKAVFDNVPVGTYEVKEITSSVRYEITNPQNVTVTADNTSAVTFENKLKKGSIKIIKTSEDGIVKDLYFKVMDSEGNEIGIFATKASGVAGVSKLPVYNKNNEKITYTVTELGKKNADGTYSIPFRYDNPEPQSMTLNPGETAVFSFENKLKRGSVILNKQDGDGNPLAGAEFELYEADGTKITAKETGAGSYSLSDEGVTILKTDEDGKLYIDQLPQGDYYFIETKAPDGHMPYAQHIDFIVGENSNPEITVKDNRMLMYNTGSVGNTGFYVAAAVLFTAFLLLTTVYFYKKRKHSSK